jgi:hypothetical protein
MSPVTPQGQQTAKKMTQVTQMPVSQQLDKMAYQKLEELRTKFKSEISYRGQNQKDTTIKQDPTPALKTCESAQITSVTPATIRPGWPLTIKGCGFLSVTDLLMYDPKGPNDAFSEPWYLKIDKLTDTEIETRIPKVDTNGGIGFFTKPIPISVRMYSLGEKSGYSNPGNLVLEPNMEIYIVQGLKPAKLRSCSVPAMIDSEAGINTVFHCQFLNAPQLYPNKSGESCNFIDILFWGKKLEEGFTFENVDVIYERFCYTTDNTWESIIANNKCAWGGVPLGANSITAKIVEKNLDSFKGTPFVPKISVEWNTFENGALLYKWAIFVRGPEGLASFGF